MSPMREAYLLAAESAATLLADPAVAAGWTAPSALAEFTVGGLAEHLAQQILSVPAALDRSEPTGERVSLLGHYERVTWIGADLHADVNVEVGADPGHPLVMAEQRHPLAGRLGPVQRRRHAQDLLGQMLGEPTDGELRQRARRGPPRRHGRVRQQGRGRLGGQQVRLAHGTHPGPPIIGTGSA